MAGIIRQTTVVRDGFHNGFTDLCYWQGQYWVSYRKGSGHATMDGEGVVAVSVDRARFREVARLKMPGDNRGPKLVPMGDDRLGLIFASWRGEYKSWALEQYVSFTADGFNWEPPERIMEPGQWLWRVRQHEGIFYGLVKALKSDRKDDGMERRLMIMTSNDLREWSPLAEVGDAKLGLGESDIFFREDGEVWLVGRRNASPGNSYFAAAKPPYTDWGKPEALTALIHAPIILPHRGKLYVSGRCLPALEGIAGWPTRYSLAVWELTRGKVEPVLRIPALGDCAYPGLIEDPDGRICLSYYSQHAYLMGSHESPAKPDDLGDRWLEAADVYFAELDLP